MGQQLLKFFTRATEIGGINARTRLSVLTGIASVQAQVVEDTPDKLAKFEEAFAEIEKEYAQETGGLWGASPEAPKPRKENLLEAVARGRRQMELIGDLIAQREVFRSDINRIMHRVTESMADGIAVERGSIWYFEEEKQKIICKDLFVHSKKEHVQGEELFQADFPAYFASLHFERVIAAHDAHTDPATREFSEDYLKPLDINSMLDVPLWVHGKMIGVLCYEHVGTPRNWTEDEVQFGCMLANAFSMMVELYRQDGAAKP